MKRMQFVMLIENLKQAQNHGLGLKKSALSQQV